MDHASTEPRRERRGDSSPAMGSNVTGSSFNGAASGTTRRPRVPPGRGDCGGGFNGAASGTTRRHRRQRPRRQHIRGFNGAASGTTRRHVALHVVVQFQHRASTEPRRERRGDSHREECGSCFQVASTEPRRERRGDAGGSAYTDPPAAASTEPRRERRGDSDSTSRMIRSIWLQRSRVGNDAETGRSGAGHVERHGELQRSRVGNDAETWSLTGKRALGTWASTEPRRERRGDSPRTGVFLALPCCFNGAASGTTRRPRPRGWAAPWNSWLQRSRVGNDAETLESSLVSIEAFLLQRSRVGNDAETEAVSVDGSEMSSLQRSRVGNDAETPRRKGCHHTGCRCFNGAASGTTRRPSRITPP